MWIKRAITLSPLALQHVNFSFPDCSPGTPLSANAVCDTSLDYWTRATSLVAEFTTQELINNTINTAPGVTRLGIPPYQWWTEALHGVAGSPGVNFADDVEAPYGSATNFPQIINLGATFDDALYEQVATHIANETRAFNNAGKAGLNMYSPLNINCFRDPRWGRGQETTGEDPLHMSRYAVKMVQGLQGPNQDELRLAATCKHYLAYDLEKWDGVERYQFDAQVSRQELAEFYLPQFRACVRDGKAVTLMTSYNAVNNVPPSASRYYLETLARKEWGLDKKHNYVTSDCDAVANVFDGHHYADSYVQAAADSINAGTDLNCGATYSDNLGQALEQNLTDVETIRTAVARMYASQVRLGLFDPKQGQPLRELGWEHVNTKAAQDLAYSSAAASVTLLKNNGTLPVDGATKVAVIGPYSNATFALRGNYAGPGPFAITMTEAAQRVFSQATISSANGTTISGTYNQTDAEAAMQLAKEADLVVFAGGIDPTIESEELDRATIAWPPNQLQLIHALGGMAKKMAVVQFGGGQIDGASIKADGNIGALLWAGYPGQSGALAVMDVIAGNTAPAGRLPITQYPAEYIDGLAETTMALRPNETYPGRTYKWYSGTPTYPYAHGLHYTKFKAELAQPAPYTIATAGYAEFERVATVQATITNAGQRTSDYAALVFARHTNGPAPHPNKTLVGYKKVKAIAPGESRSVEVEITQAALARGDEEGNLVLYPGKYELELDTEENVLAKTQLVLQGDQASVVPWVQGDMS